jgi:hypothetical protein
MLDEADDTAYKYEDLCRKDGIRLIRLDQPTDPYTFSTFMIEDSPRYHALSYCWGELDRSETISCNEGILKVTPNLKLALAELEAIPQLRTWLWIDQISINQGDLQERSHQVQLMPKIYKRAIRTVIWLGPSSPNHAQGSLDETEDDALFDLAERIF